MRDAADDQLLVFFQELGQVRPFLALLLAGTGLGGDLRQVVGHPFRGVGRAPFAQPQPRLRQPPFRRLAVPAAQQDREILVRFFEHPGPPCSRPFAAAGPPSGGENRVLLLGVHENELPLSRQVADQRHPMLEISRQQDRRISFPQCMRSCRVNFFPSVRSVPTRNSDRTPELRAARRSSSSSSPSVNMLTGFPAAAANCRWVAEMPRMKETRGEAARAAMAGQLKFAQKHKQMFLSSLHCVANRVCQPPRRQRRSIGDVGSVDLAELAARWVRWPTGNPISNARPRRHPLAWHFAKMSTLVLAKALSNRGTARPSVAHRWARKAAVRRADVSPKSLTTCHFQRRRPPAGRPRAPFQHALRGAAGR